MAVTTGGGCGQHSAFELTIPRYGKLVAPRAGIRSISLSRGSRRPIGGAETTEGSGGIRDPMRCSAGSMASVSRTEPDDPSSGLGTQ